MAEPIKTHTFDDSIEQMNVIDEPIQTEASPKPFAVYTICGCGGGNAGPNYSYVKLKSLLEKHNVDVYLLETVPNHISLNVAYMMKEITANIDKYSKIYLIGWSMGGAVVSQVAYFINKFIRPEYVAGIIYLASQGADNQLFYFLECNVILIHGELDSVIPVKVSQIRHDKFHGKQKNLIILSEQGHDFSHESSDIAEIMYSLFF